MHDGRNNLYSQLQGLRLSDGSFAGDRLRRSPASEPAFSALSAFSTSPHPPKSVAHSSANPEEASQLPRASASPQLTKVSSGAQPPEGNTSDNDCASPVSPLQLLHMHLERNGAGNAGKPRPPTQATGPRDKAAKAPVTHEVSSSTHKKSDHNNTPTTSSSPGGVAVPKPRSDKSRTTDLSAQVLEFFQNTTGVTPTVVASADVLQQAKVISVQSKTKVAQPASSNELPQPDAATRARALAANGFLVEALGGERINNRGATRPIIRRAPSLGNGGRYIIVGDVHGCVEQLEALVEKVRYQRGKDCLIVVGDYVNKGPDSIGVIRLCQRYGAIGVLGNHDQTLLECCAQRPFSGGELRDPVKRLAMNFPLDCEYYLRGLPHVLRLPSHNVLVVHAGLNLERRLERQSVDEVMNIRRLEVRHGGAGDEPHYVAVNKGPGGVPWGELWRGPEVVVFGHDAYAGFQHHQYAYGIDTGCVYGDPLTCAVFTAAQAEVEFFSVPGLPKASNELLGLPPPDSEIYEQQQRDLERRIIRPTTRATPVTCAAGANSSFLATPPLAGVGGDGPVTASSSPATASSPHATAAGGADGLGGKSASPPRLQAVAAKPTSIAAADTRADALGVVKSSLLALSAAHDLEAIAVLLRLPDYERTLDPLMRAEAADTVAQHAFWNPLTQNILTALQASVRTSQLEASVTEEVVHFILAVCDEMEELRAVLRPQLLQLSEDSSSGSGWSRGMQKFISVLLE